MMTSAINNDDGEARVKELSGSGHDEDTKVVSTDSEDRVVNDHDDEYIQSSAATCPPLVKLQFYGMCCPFIESEEEHDAREGYSNLQNYPITWYRKKLISDLANDAKQLAPNASGLIDGIGQLFRSGSTTSNNSSKRQQQNKHDGTSIPMTHVGVLATIAVVDTDDHGPVIQIRTLDSDNPSNQPAQNAIREYMTNGKPWWEDPCIRDQPPSKVIPLYMVDKVASGGWSFSSDPTSGGIKLYAAPESKGLFSSAGPELLRFDTLGGGGSTLSDAIWSSSKPNEPNKYADKVIVQLKSLVDWNRRRMAKDIKRGRVGVAPKSTGTGYVSMT